jgi:hypothetical protein
VRAYEFLDRPATCCIHFVTAREVDVTLKHEVDEAIRRGVKYVYWDYLDGGGTSITIADPLGRTLQLEHAPYGGQGGEPMDQILG